MVNPCLSCGACCATFRVSFYRGETVPGPQAVPDDLVVPVSPFLVAMRGTTGRPPRCVALEGTVGEATRCAIHPVRSSTCRGFEASWSNGVAEPACDRARLAHGLRALTPEDWAPPAPRSPPAPKAPPRAA